MDADLSSYLEGIELSLSLNWNTKESPVKQGSLELKRLFRLWNGINVVEVSNGGSGGTVSEPSSPT
jgi:hypothetical protein